MIAVDTNVLLYARDPRAPAKQARALELIRTLSDAALRWQVACEYVAACVEADVGRLYTKDLSDQSQSVGLEVVNPFS